MLRKTFFLCGAALCAMNMVTHAQNPYLPLWEHVPDGEPYVFEDPDAPGKYRVYVYGSHDILMNQYCGLDNRVWSAPVDNLGEWRDEGPVFSYFIDGQWDTMFAPDIAEVVDRETGKKIYYLYPHSRGEGRIPTVCKSNRPDGPFSPINLTADGRACVEGSMIDFDPGVLIDYVTDKKDPDYATGFRAYAYWGFTHSYAAELDPATMYSTRPGTEVKNYFIPSRFVDYVGADDPEGTTYPALMEGENVNDYNFFEASSIRKVGNKYVFIYSGMSGHDYGVGTTNSSLRYAYGDTPFGPWKSGGVLVDSRGIVPNEDGTALIPTNGQNNTHGSIAEINGQWYCFYHRTPRSHAFARQAMVAPINVEWDKKPVSRGGRVRISAYDPYAEDHEWHAQASNGSRYNGAEVTSEGFQIFGLDPYRYYSAGITCFTIGHRGAEDTYDCWNNHAALLGVADKHIIGYKYFGFGGLENDTKGIKAFAPAVKGNETMLNIWVKPLSDVSCKIRVMIDGPYEGNPWKGRQIAVINVPAKNDANAIIRLKTDVAEVVEGLKGKHAIYFIAEGSEGVPLFDFIGLGFSSRHTDIEPPHVPTVTLAVDGKILPMPTVPITPTNANGFTEVNRYQLYVPLGVNSQISATANDPAVQIEVSPVVAGRASVICTYRGQQKIYLLN